MPNPARAHATIAIYILAPTSNPPNDGWLRDQPRR
jgi:hypothetical protein